MTEKSQSSSPSLPLWEVVPISDYKVPAEPAKKAASMKLNRIWRFFKGGSDEADPVKSESALKRLPDTERDQVAPAINWHPAALALDAAIEPWTGHQKPEPPVLFFIGPPFSGYHQVVTAWAALHGWPVMDPPDPKSIVSHKSDAPFSIAAHPDGWVLPRLERFFLRHAQGLSMVRYILKRALLGHMGRGVIGCDSWAWAFLQKACPIPQVRTLTLQGFDAERLSVFFYSISGSSMDRPIRFRHAGTGKELLPLPEVEKSDDLSVSGELKHLAAHSRGNLGIGWRYWRKRLCIEPDAPAKSAAGDEAKMTPQGLPEQTIWFAADAMEPEMPAEDGEDAAIVLHALLLHGGLGLDLLKSVLPLSRSRILAVLTRLEAGRLVACRDGLWRVAALGYGAVRQFVRDRGYLTDGF